MEYDKINNLLDSSRNKLSKFVTRNWINVHNQSGDIYDYKKQIRFKTSILRSDLCDYSDVYILEKGLITVVNTALVSHIRDIRDRPLVLKNNSLFISCISKINNELIENAEDLDIVMPMYNLLEYSQNYRKTTGSLFNYYRDELSDDADDNNSPNIKVINSKSFKYKSGITGTASNDGTKDVEIAVPLKYLGNFWRKLDISLINCEISLILTWDKNCVTTSLKKKSNRSA